MITAHLTQRSDINPRHPAMKSLHDIVHALAARIAGEPAVYIHPMLVSEDMFAKSRAAGKTKPEDVHAHIIERLTARDEEMWTGFLKRVAHIVFVDCHGIVADWNAALRLSPLRAREHHLILDELRCERQAPAPSSARHAAIQAA